MHPPWIFFTCTEENVLIEFCLCFYHRLFDKVCVLITVGVTVTVTCYCVLPNATVWFVVKREPCLNAFNYFVL